MPESGAKASKAKRERAPRKPSLSPSKISTYLACPVKYKWTYLDDRGKWLLKSKSYYSFGTSLHVVLQRFHDNNDAGVTNVAEAISALEEGWIDAGYDSQTEMREALADGKAIVERYVNAELQTPATSKTIAVEKALRADLGPFVLLGRVDRLDENESGEIEVVDYKSGRLGVKPEDVKNDLAMGCYQLLVSRMYPDRAVRLTIIALRAEERATTSLDPEELAAFERDLIALGEEILNRDFENIEPVVKPFCPQCDFVSLCRHHPEFRSDLEAQLAADRAAE